MSSAVVVIVGELTRRQVHRPERVRGEVIPDERVPARLVGGGVHHGRRVEPML